MNHNQLHGDIYWKEFYLKRRKVIKKTLRTAIEHLIITKREMKYSREEVIKATLPKIRKKKGSTARFSTFRSIYHVSFASIRHTDCKPNQ